jgi:hypothetical protein
MSLVNFTNLDFDQIKISIKDYLRSNSNFRDYDFEGSNLSQIIDVLAYNTYISSYNANMISNEVFIDSATLRENVVSLARNIGYVPRSRKASRARITFFIDTTPFTNKSTTLTLKSGLVCTSSSRFGDQNFTFCISEDITVPIVNNIASFDDIYIYEGSYITSKFTVSSEGSNSSQRYILNNANIDTSSIRVLIQDGPLTTNRIKYNVSENILNIDSESEIFFLQEIEDQRYELIFGDGIFGKKLKENNIIECSYLITNGENGNGIQSFTFAGRILDNNGNLISDRISLITSSESSNGGNEIESVSSIKNYSTRIFSSFNRAVTASDYEALIPKIYPETQSVSVFGGEDLDPPQFGKVFITIKPFHGPFLSNTIKNNLKNLLRKYSVAGIVPQILDLKYVYVEYNTTAYYNENKSSGANEVGSLISKNIEQYAKSVELNKYGAKFKYSKFQKIVDDSDDSITSNITVVSIRRDLRASINQFSSYEICYGNSFHVGNMNGYNIRSSGFSVKGIEGVVYLSDIPKNTTEGDIFLFKLKSPKSPNIVNSKIGKVDYIKGEIILLPIYITGTEKNIGGEPIIEISVSPESNDIIGKQDLYLQLDINNSSLNVLLDDISSGADLSGTTYKSTTSYTTEEILIRE